MVTAFDVDEAFRRSVVLDKLDLLSVDESASFDRLTRIATRLVDAPVSLATMVAEDHQWFLGCTGMKEPYATTRRTPLSHSFCQYVVASKSPLIISDARLHPLVKENLAIRDLDVIAYLGIPLVTSDGVAVGSFCVIDDRPRIWQPDEIELLEELATSVMTEVELRYELEKRRKAELILSEFIREQEATRIAREMTVALAHDIRTPLSSIQLRVDMLKKRTGDEQTTRWLDSIQSGVSAIVNIIQDFSMLWTPQQLTQHDKTINFVDTILNNVIENIYQLPQVSVDTTHINVTELESNLPVQCNVPLLQVAIYHIIENSVIYNHADLKQIEVIVECHRDNVAITIQDNGDGIPADDLSHVFSPLYKSNKARSANQSRSGLGLTIARQIIESHGGTIEIDSQFHQGTTITVYLPLAR